MLTIIECRKEQNARIKPNIFTAVALAVDAHGEKQTTKIFSNVKLYNIPYGYFDTNNLIERIGSRTIRDGYIIIDIDNISPLSLNILTNFCAVWHRLKKLRLLVCVSLYPSEQLDTRLKRLAQERIACDYNHNTHCINLVVNNMVRRIRHAIHYYVPRYFKYYIADKETG